MYTRARQVLSACALTNSAAVRSPILQDTALNSTRGPTYCGHPGHRGRAMHAHGKGTHKTCTKDCATSLPTRSTPAPIAVDNIAPSTRLVRLENVVRLGRGRQGVARWDANDST
eukprot:6686909-Pyramimonas_sp.AAC.1